ncbi:phage portal protein [Neisseria sp. Ec49-e6-T10]|uniref:phage portal protein n=1 Tax=Neisseria sp. Ec49-e6-T10 TaxID=3140744 RepID=UPI003EBF9449
MSMIKNFTAKLFGKKTSTAYDHSFNLEIPEIDYYWKLDNCSVAADGVDKVASAIANSNPISKDGDNVIKTRSVDLLNKPNDKATGDDLVYKITEDIYKNKSAYVVLVGNVNSAPIEIHYVKGKKVNRFLNSHGDIDYITIFNDDYAGTYVYDEKNRLVDIQTGLKQLVIIEYPSERSHLQNVALEIAVLTDGLKRNAALMQNGGRLSTLITFKDSPTQTEFQSRLESVDNQIRRKNYGGILATNGELDLKEMGLTPRDMDFIQLQEACEARVYLGCGVPLPLVKASASTFNNYETAQENFYTETVIPLANMIYSTIGEEIAKRENKKYTTLTNIQEIPVIQKMLTKAAKDRKDLGVETINEMRQQLGLSPHTNGDILLVESRYVPIESLGVEI